MPDPSSNFRSELEADWFWRQEEILFLQNRGARLTVARRETLFRSAVLILYAHLEGFIKFSFQAYILEVNRAALTCSEAIPAVVAASISEFLKELRNPTKKCHLFKKSLPHDEKLHVFAREQEFVERVAEIGQSIVKVPDYFVDTESNLKPVVLRKLMYQVGLPYDLFAGIEGDIDRLLNYRNQIAHGSMRGGIREVTYMELRRVAFGVVSTVMLELTDAVAQTKFRKAV